MLPPKKKKKDCASHLVLEEHVELWQDLYIKRFHGFAFYSRTALEVS